MEINNSKTILFILIISPYLYLFPHSFQLIEMGNDFELLYYSYKKYIFEFIRIGHFPLWSPSESLGYPLVFNPFAQYFYPLSWLLYLFGFIIGDLSKHTYLLYTIFGLSIYNIGQYFWLRSLNIEKKYCLVATLITCFGLKLTEILRFPNAVHAIAWFPWILYSINLSTQKFRTLKSSLIIFLCSIMIISAGYPYYILYGLVLFSFYFLFINIPFVKSVFFKNNLISTFSISLIRCLIPSLVALLIMLPWFLGISEIMEITRDRNLKDISFSHILSSNPLDQIGSWILPPISFAESNYYFGSIITLSLILYFFNFFLEKVKNKKELYFIIFFFVFFVFNYQFAAAENSFLFKIIWNNIEIIQNFRAFCRMNILLIPLFAVLIAFTLKHLEKNIFSKKSIYFLIFISIFIVFSQIYLLEVYSAKTNYWVTWQEKRLDFASIELWRLSKLFGLYNNYIYSIFFVLSFIFLFFLYKIKNKINLPFSILLLVVGELFILSNIQWAIPYNYYDSNKYNSLNNNPLKNLREAFTNSNLFTVAKGNTYFRNNKKFNVNYVEQLGFDSHTRLVDKYFTYKGNYINKNIINKSKVEFFWGMDNDARKVFFSRSISFETIPELVDMIIQSEKNQNLKIGINLEKYTGDNIELNVKSEKDGYIIIVDNWSPGWIAKINNNPAQIYKVLNAYKSVKINAGTNIINFIYKPW